MTAPVRAGTAGREQPLYRAIIDRLTLEIAGGVFAIGDRLPTEAALCARFGASRHTVRAALKQLQDGGLIRRRQGSGSVVAADRPRPRYSASIASLEELMQYAEATWLEVQAVAGRLPPDPRLGASGLTGQAAAPLAGRWVQVMALRRQEAGGRPIARTEIWLPQCYDAVVPEIGRERLAVCRLIERRFGLRVSAVRQAITAEAADGDTADGLGIPEGSAVLRVDRVYEAGAAGIVEIALNSHPPGRFSYGLTLRQAE